MDQAPQTEPVEIWVLIWNFIVKNILGILSILFGVTMKVHMLRGKFKRITKNQCKTIVFISGLSGVLAWYIVAKLDIKDIYKAFITAYTPIMIEPITLRAVLWVDPIVDEIGASVKKIIKKKSD